MFDIKEDEFGIIRQALEYGARKDGVSRPKGLERRKKLLEISQRIQDAYDGRYEIAHALQEYGMERSADSREDEQERSLGEVHVGSCPPERSNESRVWI